VKRPSCALITAETREALEELLAAARPYLERAAPHEQLWNGADLRDFERLSAARGRAEDALRDSL
jgi:hypothetical protein